MDFVFKYEENIMGNNVLSWISKHNSCLRFSKKKYLTNNPHLFINPNRSIIHVRLRRAVISTNSFLYKKGEP